MNKQFIVVVGLISIFSAVMHGCRTGKSVVSRNGKVENLSHSRLIDSIARHHLKIEQFSTKASTDLNTEERKVDFKTNFRIRNDSIITFNIQAATLVLFNGIISRDTVIIANKREKRYFAGGFNYINELFNAELDYYMLQDLLLGNLINFDPEEKYKMKEDTAYYFVSTVGKRKLRRTFEKERLQKKEPYIYRYWIYPGIFRPARTIINDLTDSTSLEVNYMNYEMVDSALVPSEIQIIASSPQQKIELQLKYKSIRINEPAEYYFTIPEGYEKMD